MRTSRLLTGLVLVLVLATTLFLTVRALTRLQAAKNTRRSVLFGPNVPDSVLLHLGFQPDERKRLWDETVTKARNYERTLGDDKRRVIQDAFYLIRKYPTVTDVVPMKSVPRAAQSQDSQEMPREAHLVVDRGPQQDPGQPPLNLGVDQPILPSLNIGIEKVAFVEYIGKYALTESTTPRDILELYYRDFADFYTPSDVINVYVRDKDTNLRYMEAIKAIRHLDIDEDYIRANLLTKDKLARAVKSVRDYESVLAQLVRDGPMSELPPDNFREIRDLVVGS